MSSRTVLSGAVANFASYYTPGSTPTLPKEGSKTGTTRSMHHPWTRSAQKNIVPVSIPIPSNSLSSLTTTLPSASTASDLSLPKSRPKPRRQYFTEKRRKRHHAYGKDVPYTLSYERFLLDHDDMDVYWNMGLQNGPTANLFDSPPKRVLDLGCGTGAWVLAAAKEWKDAHFVGLDLVPIQPNLDLLSPPPPPGTTSTTTSYPLSFSPPQHPISADLRRARSSSNANSKSKSPTRSTSSSIASASRNALTLDALIAGGHTTVPEELLEVDEERNDASLPVDARERIRWVHANFLEKLPFPDGHFDYVHMRKISRGVPENKWDHLFSEINRVLRSGGVCEIMETNLSLPGSEWIYRPPGKDDDSEPTKPSFVGKLRRPREQTQGQTESVLRRQPSVPFSSSTAGGVVGAANFFGSSYAPPPKPPPVPPPHEVPSKPSASFDLLSSTSSSSPKPPDPRDHALLESIYTSLHESKFINLSPLSVIANYLVLHFSKIFTHPPLILLAPKRSGDGHAVPMEQKESFVPTNGIINALEVHEWAKIEMGLVPIPPWPACSSDPGQKRVEDYMASDKSRITPRLPLPGARQVRSMNGLPNRTYMYDTAHAGMMLGAGVAEVLACKEEMWEHVRGLDPSAERVVFEELVGRFDVDMKNRIGIRHTLRDRLAWESAQSSSASSKHPSQLQKDFEAQLKRVLEEEDREGIPPEAKPGKMVSRTIKMWVAFKD